MSHSKYLNLISFCILLTNYCLLLVKGQNVTEMFFEQKLDHVGVSPETWRQRFLENREYFKPGGPVFIAFGGPPYAPVIPIALQKGSMVQYAKDQGANLILIESRYFGQSRPTLDLKTENMEKFHTIQNTVDDKVNFIKWLKTQSEFMNSKVVGFGIGFTGSRLVQIMRSNVGLIDVGVMSSTPVEVKYEIPEYIVTAVEIMQRLDPQCTLTLRDALICLDKITRGETCEGHNLADLKETFNLCDNLDPSKPLDSAGIRAEVIKSLGGVILLNNPDPMIPYNVQKMCAALGDTSKGLSHMDKMAKEIKKILAIRKMKCLEFRYEKIIEKLQTTEWDTPGTKFGERQAIFSRCSNGINIRTLDSLTIGAFGVGDNYTTNYTLELCQRLFNISPQKVRINTEMFNQIFGARQIPSQCGIFVSGGDDLFKGLAIKSQEEAGNCNKAITIEGASFARDRWEILPQEMSYPKGLRAAQLQIGKLIEEWLRTGNCCMTQAKKIQDYPPFIFDVL